MSSARPATNISAAPAARTGIAVIDPKSDQAGEERDADGHSAAERDRTRVPPVGPWCRNETESQRERPAERNQGQRKQEGEKERTTERRDRGWQS